MPHTHDEPAVMTFGRYLKTLRTAAKVRGPELAGAIGISPSSYSNAEYSAFRLLGKKRIEAIATKLNLEPAHRARLFELWEALPLSDFAIKRAAKWQELRDQRAANADNKTKAARVTLLEDEIKRLRAAIASLLQLHVMDESTCECVDAEGFVCELCRSMKVLGFERWIDGSTALEQLQPDIDHAEALRGSPRVDDESEFGGG